MKDVDIDPDAESPYECYACGRITVAVDPPTRCDSCGGALRNRLIPLE